jgi:hypothetical protein
MKLPKYLLAIAVLTVAFTFSAQAHLDFLGAQAFDNPNSPDHNHDVLEAFLGFDPGALSSNFEGSASLSGPVAVTPGEFFVVHYGKGTGGSAKGGSFEFFQVAGGETSVTFPQFGNEAGDDPFGHGGISSARGFGGGTVPTPDSGTTAMLLGSAFAGLGLMRRYLKR